MFSFQAGKQEFNEVVASLVLRATLIINTGLLSSGSPSNQDCQCGKWTNPSMSNARIVNGEEAKPHSIPWQVKLVRDQCQIQQQKMP